MEPSVPTVSDPEFFSILIKEIKTPKRLLRHVNRNSYEYQSLRESIKEYGVITPIAVRRIDDWSDLPYELICGMQRLSCCIDLELTHIKANILEGVSDWKSAMLQVQENAQRVTTFTRDYARRLKYFIEHSPEVTLLELSHTLKKSIFWIKATLKLMEVPRPVGDAMDAGEIPLATAYRLADLPRDIQLELLPLAKHLPVEEFVNHLEQIGITPDPKARSGNWKPHLRPAKAVVDATKDDVLLDQILGDSTCPREAAKQALLWVLHQDKERCEAMNKREKRKQEQEDKQEDKHAE